MSERGIDMASVETQKGPDSRYFSVAVRWENDVIRSVKRPRFVAWLVAGFSAILAGLAMACLAMLLPLKSFLLAQIVPLTARIASSTQEWAVGSGGTLRGLVTTVAAGHKGGAFQICATKSSPRCTTRDSKFI